MAEKGKLIVLEGLDGAGTTSMSEEIVKHFSGLGVPMVFTAEPYSPELEPLLRKFISGEYTDPGWRPMALLFGADRLIHCRDLVDVLAGGMNVVCDRYIGSTVAYQSALAHTDDRYDARAFIREHLSPGTLAPDLTLFLQADVKTCVGRRSKSRDTEDYYERVTIQYQVEEAYEVWLQESKDEGLGEYLAVDANRNYWSVRDDCFNAVENLLMDKGVANVRARNGS